MQSLYPALPAFSNPFLAAPHNQLLSRSRSDLPFLDDDSVLHRLVQATLEYAGQPPQGNPPPPPSSSSPFRYGPTRSSLDSSASADSGGDVYSFGPNPGTVYATSYPALDAPPSPPSRQLSDRGDPPSNRFVSQSPVSSPVAPSADSPARLNFSFPPSISAPSSQLHFPHLRPQPDLHSPTDRFPPLSNMLSADRYPRLDRYSFPPGQERRMSEPNAHYSSTNYSHPATYPASNYALHRAGSSAGSFSDMYSGSEWAPKREHDDRDRGDKGQDVSVGMPRFSPREDPYSPIHSSFSGASSTSSLPLGTPSPHPPLYSQAHYNNNTARYPAAGAPSVPPGPYPVYDPADEESGSRPSTSGSMSYSYSPTTYPSIADQANKTYSFVSLPGNTVRKRPRRRYDEIERLYACNYSGCTKAYGTLNHLNAHVNMQKHGAKRHPNEFKELRKQWRKVKKEMEQEREGQGPSPAQRRRRATEPNLFPSSELAEPFGDDGYQAQGQQQQQQQQQQHLQGLGGLDVAYPPAEDSGSGHGFPQSQSQLGYGHPHYATSSAYQSQRSQPTSAAPSPPPINRLPANSTLLAPLNLAGYGHGHGHGHAGSFDGSPAAAAAAAPHGGRVSSDGGLLPPVPAFHPSLQLPRLHESTPPERSYDAYGSGQR